MAHGLVLRIQDMIDQKERLPDLKNPLYPPSKATNSFVDEVNIIHSWLNAIRYPKNSKIEYFTLLRQTLMFMFSPNWQKCPEKKDLMYAYKSYYMKFSTITLNCTDVYKAVLKLADSPWENSYVGWEELFNGTASVDNLQVSNYFATEPEEIVLARVHALVIQNHVEAAMMLAKLSFLYHSRIAGHLSSARQRRGSVEGVSSLGHASIDWYAFLLRRTKTFPQIVSEVQQLRCHEGIEIIYRLQRDPKNIKFCYALLSILIMEDLIRPSQYCCTKKLFMLFCMMHKQMNSSLAEVSESARKIFANYAPTSSHLYLFVDVVWSQYGIKCLDLYIEMYVRGLTADINHLEAKKDSQSSLVSHIETHLATIFAKLSTLFSGFLDLAARECMFSAFSLRPTKERLYILQSLTQDLLSGDSNKKEKSASLSGYEGVRYCNCRLKCAGPCRTKLKDHALNPLLNLGVKSVSYHLIKDLVCVLESARSIKFQYNMFDWQSNITELGDYLKTFNQSKMALKDWGSDTEVASDEGSKSDNDETDSVSESENTHSLMTSSISSSTKRKSESCVSNPSALDVAANVEVESNDSVNKRMKLINQDADIKIQPISEGSKQYSHMASSALESIIKATLSESRSADKSSAFSEVKRQSPISHTVYPYSLTDHGKRENLNTAHRMSSKSSMNRIKSSVECQSNFIRNYANVNHNVMSSSSSLNRQNVVITPSNHAPINKSVFLQQDPRKTLPYSIQSSVVNQVHRPVSRNNSYETQNIRGTPSAENALNLSCNSDYQRNKHLHQFPSQKSQSSSPIFNSKYTNLPNNTSLTPCSSKQQVSHDRNSVIHHTMQHVCEKPIPISRELLVSLDHNSSKKLREPSQSSFCTNVKDKIFSKPEHPTFGKFNVHNPSHSNVTSSHVNDSSLVKTEALTVPGNFSAAAKDNKRNTTIIPSEKRIYKPYVQALPSKPQMDLQRNKIHPPYEGIEDMQMTKYKKQETVPNNSWSKSHWSAQNNSMVSSSSQDIRWKNNDNVPSNRQQWNSENTVTSTNQPIRMDRSVMYNVPQQKASNHISVSASNKVVQYQDKNSLLNVPVSNNQAWYSTPHNQPSAYNRNPTSLLSNSARPDMPPNTVSSFTETNSRVYSKNKLTTSTSILKSRLTPNQVFSPIAQTESYIHPNKDISTSAESYIQRHSSSQGLAERSSTLPHTQTSTSGTSSHNANSLAHSNRSTNQSEGCYNHDMYNSPVISTDERGVVVFRAANAVQPTNYSHPSSVSSSNNTQKVCCSPLEVDPCQSCSPTDSGVQEQVYDFSRERNPYQISGEVPFDPNAECPDPIDEEPDDPEVLCHFCAFSYPASLMEVHLEEAHQNEILNRKNNKSNKKNSTKRSFNELPDSKIPIIKPSQNVEYFAEKDETQTSKPLPPMQFLSETLLHGSSPQSVSNMVKEGSDNKAHASYDNYKNASEASVLSSEVFSVKHKELEISWSVKQEDGVNQQLSNIKQFENSRSATVQEEKKFFCSMCDKKVRSEAALKRHIKSSHTKLDDKGTVQTALSNETITSQMLGKSGCERKYSISEDISRPSQIFEFDSCMPEDLNTEAYQSVQKVKLSSDFYSSNETNSETQANSNDQLSGEVDASQIEDKKLKIKKSLKASTKPCQYCGKILTIPYMKTHILKKHEEMYKVLYTDSNQDISSSESKDNNLAFQSVSTLLQENIDTRTCLSPSDALNIDDKFDIAAHEQMFPSDSSVKTGSDGMFAQTTHSVENNALPKSKSKFKKINKSSQLTLKKVEGGKGMGETEFDSQPKLTDTYRCHICFRKYTTTTFLNKHLQNFHRLTMSSSGESQPDSSSCQKSLLKKQLHSESSEFEHENEALNKDSYIINPAENSDLHAADNGVQYANENSNIGILPGSSSCSDQLFSMNSDSTNAHSPNQFQELKVKKNPNKKHKLDSDVNQTTSNEKVKITKSKNHKCSICPKAFSYSKNLQKHQEKDHSSHLSSEYINNELQNLESTFQISNQQVNNEVNSHNIDQLDIGQVLQHHGTPSHGNDSFFDLQNPNESPRNNSSYSSSNPSDKVSLSKSDSFFHSNGCSSEDFHFENDFSENIGKGSSGSYSERDSFETFHVTPSAPSRQFSSPCASYNENVSYHSTEQSEVNNIHVNSNEIGNGQHKSSLFTEMLNDSVDTSSPYQANSFSNTMQSMSQSVYQQSNIHLEASSVSTESNECHVCFKKMSTQEQLKHHIEKLHPMASASTIQQNDEPFESKNNNMFSELQQAYSVINSTESHENMPSKEMVDLTFRSKTPAREFTQEHTPFTSTINQGISIDEDERQELFLSEFCNNNFGSNIDHNAFKSFQPNEQSPSNSVCPKELGSSSTITNTVEKQFEVANDPGKSSISDVSSTVPPIEQEIKKPVQKCDIFSIDPMIMADDSSALKRSWMFSDLLEEFEAHTDPSLTVPNKFDSDKCEQLSSKHEIETQERCQTNTIPNSPLVDNYLISHTKKLSEQNTLKKCYEKSDSNINNDVNFASEDNFLSERGHSVSMQDIFSDKFLDAKSDLPAFQCVKEDATSFSNLNCFLDKDIKMCSSYVSPQIIPTDEQEKAINEHLFSNDLENTSCSFEGREQCRIDAEKMDPLNNMEQLFESEEIAKEISLLLNSDNENPTQGLMNISEAEGQDSFLPDAEEPSFISQTTGQCVSLIKSENTPDKLCNTKPQSIAPEIQKLPSHKEHTCTICSKKLSHAWSLNRHIKRVHLGISKNTDKTTKEAPIHRNKQPITVGLPTEDQTNFQHNLNHSDILKVTSPASKSEHLKIANDNSDKIDESLSQKSKNSNSTLSNGNVQGKKKPMTKVKCPICLKELSSLSIRRHKQKLHPDVVSAKVDEGNLSITANAPIKQDSAVSCNRNYADLQEKVSNGSTHQKKNHNLSNKESDKAFVNPNDILNVFPLSSTNLSGAVDVAENILLHKEKDTFNKSNVPIAPDDVDNRTNRSSNLKGEKIPFIKKEIQLQFHNNKCGDIPVGDITPEECYTNSKKIVDSHSSQSAPFLNQPSILAELKEDGTPDGTLQDSLPNDTPLNDNVEMCCTSAPVNNEDDIQPVTNKLTSSSSFVVLPSSMCKNEIESLKPLCTNNSVIDSASTVRLNSNSPIKVNSPSPSSLTDDSQTCYSNKEISRNIDSQTIKLEHNSPVKNEIVQNHESQSPLVIKVEAAPSKTSVSDNTAMCASSKKNSDNNKLQGLKVNSPIKNSPKDIFSITYPKNSKACRFCHKVFRSFSILSCHLKIIHNVPVLKKPTSISEPKPTDANVDKLSPPQLSLGSNDDSDSAPILNDNFQSKTTDVKEIDQPANVLSENTEVLNHSSKQPDHVKTIEAINDQNGNVSQTKKEIKLEREIQHSHSKSHGKESIVKENIVKRRSQRNSCEIIMIKTSRKTLLPKKRRSKKIICLAGTPKRFGRNKNPCTTNNKCDLSSFSSNNKTKNTSELNHTSPPCDNSTLPKCIIKVLKGESNSVVYQIDNSPNKIESDEPIFQFPESPLEQLDGKLKKKPLSKSKIQKSIITTKQSGSFRRKKKRHTLLMTTIKAQRRLKLLNSSLMANPALNSKKKTIKIGIEQSSQKYKQNREKSHSKKALLCLEENKKPENSIYQVKTFKDSKDIKQFLMEHKQPVVYLERLTRTSTNSSLKPDCSFPIPPLDFNAKPIVRLTRIDSLTNLDDHIVAVLYENNKLKSAISENDLQEQEGPSSKANSSYPVKPCEVSIKPLDLVHSNESFPIQDELSCNTLKLPDMVVNEECPNPNNSPSDQDTPEKSYNLPFIKDCSVVIRRLSL